ncbi:hypothetical protein BD560DRAFT_303772, partial [Blakeslea trispora]
NVGCQKSIRGAGIRRLLQKNGFQVSLIDEFRTSITCPNSFAPTLQTFYRCPPPSS